MKNGGPKGINWEAALEFYLTPDSEGRIPSYQDVANKFGVSKNEVGKRAKKENWLHRRRNLYDLAEETYTDNRIELINQTVRKHITAWQDIQNLSDVFLDQIDKDLTEGKFKWSLVSRLAAITRILKIAIEGERTALGLPNSVNPSSVQLSREEVTLSPEMVAEIDHLFEINRSVVVS